MLTTKKKEKATHGLGYKLTLTRNSDNAVLNKANDVNIGENKIVGIERYVPHYTPSISQQSILSEQIVSIVSKTPTELQYVKTSVFIKRSNYSKFMDF